MAGAEHAELKLVARKGKGRCAVAVGGVAADARQHAQAGFQIGLFGLIAFLVGDGLHNGGQFVAEEHRHNGGRRFACAQTVVVAR